MRRKPARWYFSFRSPYSWFAHHDLTKDHPAVADALEWIPFWEPDEQSSRLLKEAGATFPYTPMTRDKHFYVLQDTRRLAQRRGLSMVWPVDRRPHWEPAHLGYLLAKERGRHREFAAAVYHARWEEGADICDPAAVGDLAAQVGLDRAALRDAVDDPRIRAAGAAVLAGSSRDGVFGVPFFVDGRNKFWGVERLGEFVQTLSGSAAISPVLSRERPAPPAGSRIADIGHAGGCG